MARDVTLSRLVGRMVRDKDGRTVGRIEELIATIHLREHGNDYLVTEFHLGAYGYLEALTGSRFAQKLLQHIPVFRYRAYRIPWNMMDLTEPERPRLIGSVIDIDAQSSRLRT
jgi:sporulation protein YlmC with PRC-barrel domain